MRALSAILIAACFLLLGPAPVSAWGFEVHKFIVDQAIHRLPDPIRPFYEKHRASVVEHAIDPDLWRNAGFTEEPPNHFMDLDAYGEYPFAGLPRDLDRATQKFGPEAINANGRLPWRVAEFHGRLRRAFEEVGKGTAYAFDDLKFFASVLGHYVADAHVPLHAVINYDGQLTGQRGVHSRFETDLFARYRDRLTRKPLPLPSAADPREFTFGTLLASFKLAEPVLAADARAIGDRDVYDAQYFDAFFAEIKPVLEQRLNESIGAVAAIIASAWEQAGRPAVPLDPPRRDQRRRPSGE